MPENGDAAACLERRTRSTDGGQTEDEKVKVKSASVLPIHGLAVKRPVQPSKRGLSASSGAAASDALRDRGRRKAYGGFKRSKPRQGLSGSSWAKDTLLPKATGLQGKIGCVGTAHGSEETSSVLVAGPTEFSSISCCNAAGVLMELVKRSRCPEEV